MVWQEGERSGALELEDLKALKHLLNDSFEHRGVGGGGGDAETFV